ncbi:MAG: hypothetical protein NTX22_15930 [Ignavibacteriales bacterium]|nr:hypothetical protein [Ignavibacteriales bacterium]
MKIKNSMEMHLSQTLNFALKKLLLPSIILFNISSCCSSSSSKQEGTNKTNSFEQNLLKENSYKNIAPSQAFVSGKIKELNEEVDGLNGILEIFEIISYGAATQPLPVGSTIEIHFSNDLIKTIKAKTELEIKINGEYNLLIQNYSRMNETNNSYWNVIKVNK